jgi:hypothetical protein
VGWRYVEDADYLIEVSRVEREGAEWRNIFLTIVALVITFSGLTNLAKYAFEIPIRLPLVVTFANPALVVLALFVLLLMWGLLLDTWLSGFPNQTIGLACVEAKRALSRSHGPVREFEDYRAITVSDPQAFKDDPGAQWSLIAKRRLPDGRWRCLVRERSWFRYDRDSDEKTAQSYH